MYVGNNQLIFIFPLQIIAIRPIFFYRINVSCILQGRPIPRIVFCFLNRNDCRVIRILHCLKKFFEVRYNLNFIVITFLVSRYTFWKKRDCHSLDLDITNFENKTVIIKESYRDLTISLDFPSGKHSKIEGL